MSSNLVDLLKGYVTPDLVAKASSILGAPEGSVARALPTGLTTVLAGLANKSGDSSAMGQIFSTITDSRNDPTALSKPGALAPGSPISDLGNKLLSFLFGDKLGAVESVLGQVSGVKAAGSSGILSVVAPIAISALGGLVRKQGLGAGAFASMLSSQKDSILAAAPAGLSGLLGGLGGLGGGLAAAGAGMRPVVPATVAPATVDKRSSGWIWAVILLALVALGLWWAFRKKPEAAIPAETAAVAVATAAPAPVAAGPKMVASKVCGNEIMAAEDGIEMKLVSFIEDKSKAVDQTTWFDFDRLLFETGSATLKPESSAQLKNVAAILTCYPNAKVKIGGYTDNTGDAAANVKLSQARADSVSKELAGMGIAADRMAAEGYGDQHPIGDNNTEEGRAKNRRISLRVTAK